MAKRSRKRQSSMAVSIDSLEKLAAEVVGTHHIWISQGLRLTGACRLWRCNDGTWTGRFVYRSIQKDPGMAVTLSSVHTVRGIRFA